MIVFIPCKPGILWEVDLVELTVSCTTDRRRYKLFYSTEHLIKYLLKSKAEVQD